jgi:hypothetical protein
VHVCAGPWAPPIIGNLPSIYAMGMHEYLLQCLGKYGKLFKVGRGRGACVLARQHSSPAWRRMQRPVC